jgi:integrase
MSSVDRTETGRWKARYRDPNGRSRSRTFATKTEAKRFLELAGADMQRGGWVDPSASRMRFGEWAATFLATASDIDSNTRATYVRDIDRYLLPRFGNTPLSQIKALDIRQWMADELAAGIAPSSVHRHFRTLRRVLNVAVDSELLVRSPCARIRPPAFEPTEMRFLTAEEVHRLAGEIPVQFRTLVYTAAYTGMRWSELVGLRRGALDPGRRAVAVTEQLVRVERQWVRKAPKTAAGRRRIALPPFLTELLETQLADHALPGPDGLVFPNKAGKPIQQSSFNSHYWTPAKEKAGLQGVRFHDLRHTAVALAIAMGAHPKAIQARMGHGSVQVTLDRYGHLFPELDSAIAEGLDQAHKAVLRLIRGGRQDTDRPQKTQKGHETTASRGTSRALPDKAKTTSDQHFCLEAATGIEPVYRALQALA